MKFEDEPGNCVVMGFGRGNSAFSSLGVHARFYLDGIQLEFVDSYTD